MDVKQILASMSDEDVLRSVFSLGFKDPFFMNVVPAVLSELKQPPVRFIVKGASFTNGEIINLGKYEPLFIIPEGADPSIAEYAAYLFLLKNLYHEVLHIIFDHPGRMKGFEKIAEEMAGKKGGDLKVLVEKYPCIVKKLINKVLDIVVEGTLEEMKAPSEWYRGALIPYKKAEEKIYVSSASASELLADTPYENWTEALKVPEEELLTAFFDASWEVIEVAGVIIVKRNGIVVYESPCKGTGDKSRRPRDEVKPGEPRPPRDRWQWVEGVAEAMKKRGTDAGFLQEFIRARLESQVDWIEELRKYFDAFKASTSDKWEPTPDRRRSRFISDIIGRRVFYFAHQRGKGVHALSHLFFILDSSGSMSSKELAQSLSEIRSLSKVVKKITYIWCDAEVHEVREVSADELKRKIEQGIVVKGRGGTAFTPALEKVFEILKKNPPRGKNVVIIYATDGWGDQGTSEFNEAVWRLLKNNAKFIWLLTDRERYKEFEDLGKTFGKHNWRVLWVR